MPTYTIAGKKVTSAETLSEEELESLYDELTAPVTAAPAVPVEPFRKGPQMLRRYSGQTEAERKRREIEEVSKPFAERRPLMRPDEYGERFGAEPETGPSLEKVKEAGASTVMGLAGGIPRMVAGVSGLFGDTELSRLARKLESGIREKAPTKEAYDIAKYAPEAIPAGATAKVISKIPMASRVAKQLTQAAGQAATAAAVEPEDREMAAITAGAVGLIPVGMRGVGALKEKFNEIMTGGKPDIVRDQLARIAEQLGFKIEAGQVSRTTPISTPGTGEAIEKNQELANRWASAPTGESTDKVTGTFLNQRRDALGKNYDEIFQKRQFNITGDSIREFEKILELEDSISPAHVPAVKKLAQQILKNYDEMASQVQRTGTTAATDPTGRQAYSFTMDGEGLQRLRNKLRTAASTATDKTAGREIYNMIDNLDQIVKDTDPKLYEKLMDTNQKYRATMTLKELQDAKGIDAGDVSLERLGAFVRGDEYNPLFPIGNIGEQLGIRASWEPAALGSSRSAAGQAASLIKPGMGRLIFNRLARYPSSQAARNLQKKIIDAEATGGLGNLSLSAEEISVLNPILQSLREEPERKAKGGAAYTPAEQDLLRRYADGGPAKRPTLPADRSAGYKQVGDEDNRLTRFFNSFVRSLPEAGKTTATGYFDILSALNTYLYQLEPEEQVAMLKKLPDSVKNMLESSIESVKQIPEKVAAATPESAGRYSAQLTSDILLDPTRGAGKAKPVMSEAVKPKGGEFVQKGPHSLERVIKNLKIKSPFTYEDPKKLLADFEKKLAEQPEKNNFEKVAADDTIRTLKGNIAVNDWVENKLARYMRTEMATPEDPIRKLAEENILHVDPRNLNFSLDMYNKYLLPNQTKLAKSDMAKSWEGASDLVIGSETAKELSSKNNFSYEDYFIKENPWILDIANKDPERKIYFSLQKEISSSLGFDHLRDELKNSVRQDTDLPQQLRLTPEQLGRMSVPDAVRHVSKINRWREKQKAEANFALANNAATVPFKDYPDQKYGWFQLKAKNANDVSAREAEEIGEDIVVMESQKALQDALKYEGDLMGHCVGGYCDDVISGQSQIFSLRDKKTGEPHVTIEVVPGTYPVKGEDFAKLDSQTKAQYREYVRQWRRRNPQVEDLTDEDTIQALKEAGVPLPPGDIIQIKGKANKKPKDEYIPFVQDFVRSGDWRNIKDFGNTDLFEVDPSSDVANFLKSSNRPVPKYVTNDELSEILKNLGKKDSFREKLKSTRFGQFD